MAKDLTAEQVARRERRDSRRSAREVAEKKAQRSETRKTYTENYATDADRGLTSNRGTAARRDERASTWNQDGFDVNTYGKGHVSGQEMKRMRQDGMSSSEIEGMTDGMQMTARATKQLNRKKAKEKAQAVQVQTPEEATAPVTPAPGVNPPQDYSTPGTPTPKIPPSPTNPEPGIVKPNMPGEISMGDTGNVGKVGDITTTIGDGNTIIGSPIGNDYSVTIGNTGVTGGGSGLDNMMGAAAYNALNNNAWAQSQSQLNGTMGAATGIALGEQMTGASERVANLYNMAGQSQQYWNNKANAQQGLYLGDVWNQGGHDWVQAPNPESSKDRTSEILNDDDDD